jgi:hypothetical protein
MYLPGLHLAQLLAAVPEQDSQVPLQVIVHASLAVVLSSCKVLSAAFPLPVGHGLHWFCPA